jgi:tetratricopeptide (TPR) repeat protein
MIISNMMKKIVIHFIFTLTYLFPIEVVLANQSNFYNDGISLFKIEQYDKSKILFEKDIVFNPKNSGSYLYLAKIFDQKGNDKEQEINLINVLTINPNNDEAIFMLTILKIKQSDYKKSKELIDRFKKVCNLFCSKNKEIAEKFKKLSPDDEKNNY